MTYKSNEIILSICIPTFNRASILKENLSYLITQIMPFSNQIELIVSDNCSMDDTEKMISEINFRGINFVYNKNSQNIGMDRNFAKCYRLAKGKFVLCLGDDDFIMEGKLYFLLEILRSSGDVGLIHLNVYSNKTNFEKKTNPQETLLEISYWLTYITSNVVRNDLISEFRFERYYDTYLAITPLYIDAIFKYPETIIVYERIFADGKDLQNNGGYNFFKIFIQNYLTILKNNKLIGYSTFRFLKEDVFKKHLVNNIVNYLIFKRRSNYEIGNSWFIIIKLYVLEIYFFPVLIRSLCSIFFRHYMNKSWR